MLPDAGFDPFGSWSGGFAGQFNARMGTPLVRRILPFAAVLGMVLVGPVAFADSADLCSPDATPFCVTLGYGVTDALASGTPTSTAAQPVDLSLVVDDTSADKSYGLDKGPRWLESLQVVLGEAAPGALLPVLTPSSQLPDGLLVAGDSGSSGTCYAGASGTFDGGQCPAGWGRALLYLTFPAPFGGYDGVYPATFGIVSVANQASGAGVDYLGTIRYHVSNLPLISTLDGESSVTLTGQATGAPTLDAVVAWSQPVVVSGYTIDVDASLDSIMLNLHGIVDGHTILTLPRRCGTMHVDAAATSRGGTTLAAPFTLGVTGCPTRPPSLGASAVQGLQEKLTAGAATTATPNRAIAGYLWTFGDGSTATTTSTSSVHGYPSAAPRTVAVQAVDSMGALSDPRTLALKGTKASASQSRLRVVGTVVDYATGAAVTGATARLYRCPSATAPLATCTLLEGTTTSSTGGYALALPKLSAPVPVAVSVLPGGNRIGAVRRLTALPLPVVSLKTSSNTVRHGHSLTLSGAVSPDEAGKKVLVQRKYGGTWHTLAKRTLSSTSHYRYTLKPATKGTWTFRVVRPASGSNLQGISKARSVRVT